MLFNDERLVLGYAKNESEGEKENENENENENGRESSSRFPCEHMETVVFISFATIDKKRLYGTIGKLLIP